MSTESDLRKKLLKNKFNPNWETYLADYEKEIIILHTSFLPDSVDFKIRCKYFIYELNETKYCPVCGKLIIPKKGKVKLFCSKECMYSIVGKEIISKKRDNTNLKKYGNRCSLQNENIQAKAKNTFKQKYGVENSFQSKEIQAKIKDSIKSKYGVENISQVNDVKEKKKITCLSHYGVENPTQNKQISQIKKTTRRYENYEYFIRSLAIKKITPLFSKNEYVNANIGEKFKFKCKKCGEIFERELRKNGFEIRLIYCPNRIHWCSTSKAEQEIYDWLISIGITNIERNKKNWGVFKSFEADIYLPDYKLAIEYDGLYWHSNLKKEKRYHLKKYDFFKEQNIECIQIFENEWKEKKEIVKSIILNKLGKCEKIYARKCIVKEIPNDEYESFLEQNHIQGYCHAKVKLGLYFENNLVELMSFSKPRFNKKYDWENIRTCTKVGYYVIGGFSKLLKCFKKNYTGSIISYIDSRYFNGKGYISNGFRCISHSNPNHFYFKPSIFKLYSRNIFQKHKLKNKLEIYDENLSEKENMSLNGYLWIYDCGNDVLELI